jgi:hypothetical protein
MCQIVIAQLANSRSSRCIDFPAIFSLFQWITGCQQQSINVFAWCGLSLSFDSVLKAIAKLGEQCLELARQVAQQPHTLCWDNFNIQTSIFVEQHPDMPTKVQSGTFAVLYKLQDVDPSQMALSPILDCAKTVPDLEFDKHVKPTLEQLDSTLFQMQVIIVRILTTYSIHFNDYSDCPKLQHGPRHPLLLRKTQTYPLRMTTINEATVAGTIKIWHNVYDEQLKLAWERIQDIAIPSYNDQLTNACIHRAKVTRNKDVNPFLWLDNVQPGVHRKRTVRILFKFFGRYFTNVDLFHPGLIHDQEQ